MVLNLFFSISTYLRDMHISEEEREWFLNWGEEGKKEKLPDWRGRGIFSNRKWDFQLKGFLISLLILKLWLPPHPLIFSPLGPQWGEGHISFKIASVIFFANILVIPELAHKTRVQRNSSGCQILAVIGIYTLRNLYQKSYIKKILYIYQKMHLSKITPHKWFFSWRIHS